jgi:hypothetical protein
VRAGDAASVSVLVRAAPNEAFALFTREIDLWWRRGPAYRAGGAGPSRLTLEPRVGGSLLETIGGAWPREVELARVTRWEPPDALALEWRGTNFAPGERTLVEVLFRAASGGTLVTVRHSGWSALRDDHPARHGHVGADFSAFLGSWWAGLATALREHAAARDGSAP